jgi:hypothetical protein
MKLYSAINENRYGDKRIQKAYTEELDGQDFIATALMQKTKAD